MLLHSFVFYSISLHVLHVISLYCIVLHGIVLYSFFCTVSHCHVPLLQRAGELPRSASSHFSKICFVAIYALLCEEKLIEKLCLWRKKDRYEVWGMNHDIHGGWKSGKSLPT